MNFLQKLFSRNKKWLSGGLLLALAVFFCPSRAEFILFTSRFEERKGPPGVENGRRTRDRLIACGPSAIMPIIKYLRHHSPWVRGAAYLPQVLHGLGEPAHAALLTAIDSEKDPQARAYLISTLQNAFADFSRFERWLSDATDGAIGPILSAAIIRFAYDILLKYPDAPPLQTEKMEISPEFVAWWKLNDPSRYPGK